MQTYQILIEYDGEKFVGWQKQKNGKSIQGTIQKVLKKILKEKIIIFGSGRTDSGVHAFEQSAHFKYKHVIENETKFLNSVNFFLLKYNITILKIKKMNKLFHARHCAKERMYRYYIINRVTPLSLEKNRAWNIKRKLNIDLMVKGSKLLIGTKDFSTFRASSCSSKSPIKTLKEVKIKKIKNKIEITFVSRSFLQQQVRSMVGCLKCLGEGKWDLGKFKKAFMSKKRINCAPPAPPHGLYLWKVKY